jgi:hypothetical protein
LGSYSVIFSPDITVGAIANAIIFIFSVGMVWGTIRARLLAMEKKLEEFKEVLVTVASQKVELEALSRRVDDVQRFGSHRLAEVLSATRTQQNEEWGKRMDELQRTLLRDLRDK